LGLGDALALALKHQPYRTEYVDDELAGRRRGVDAHREDAHLSTILTQVGHAARQPVSFVTTMAALSRWAETREAPVPGRSR
jgi:hypothetical protein